jgi:hypothetical protein
MSALIDSLVVVLAQGLGALNKNELEWRKVVVEEVLLSYLKRWQEDAFENVLLFGADYD